MRAKTGTLPDNGVIGLAGEVTDQDGALLVFTLLANKSPWYLAGRAAADRLSATLAGCGCR